MVERCAPVSLVLVLVLVRVLVLVLGSGHVEARSCFFISETIKNNHDTVAQNLGLKEASVGASPLFSPLIQTINSSFWPWRQMMLLNATLDVYERIFSSLLAHGPSGPGFSGPSGPGSLSSGLVEQLPPVSREPVRKALKELQLKVQKLRKFYQDRDEDQMRSVLHRLDSMEVNDPVVQKKALADFKLVFQAASVIGYKHCGSTPSVQAD